MIGHTSYGVGCSKCGMGQDESLNNWQTWLGVGLVALIVLPHLMKPKRS